MKLFNRISLLLISSLVFAACERDYDAPPLNEPKYDCLLYTSDAADEL